MLGEMKNKNGIEYSINECWREIEELTAYDSGLRKEESDCDNRCGEREVEVNELNFREENDDNRRVTRRQGVVVDQTWMMPHAIEHERKGRSWHGKV